MTANRVLFVAKESYDNITTCVLLCPNKEIILLENSWFKRWGNLFISLRNLLNETGLTKLLICFSLLNQARKYQARIFSPLYAIARIGISSTVAVER